MIKLRTDNGSGYIWVNPNYISSISEIGGKTWIQFSSGAVKHGIVGTPEKVVRQLDSFMLVNHD